MAILKGKDGTVSIGGTALGTVSSFSVSLETETLETTAMGTGGWKTFEGSLQSWTGTVELMFSDADTSLTYNNSGTGTEDLTGYVNGAALAVVLTDGTSGNTYTGSAVITSTAVEVSVADLVTMSLDLTGSGELVIT